MLIILRAQKSERERETKIEKNEAHKMYVILKIADIKVINSEILLSQFIYRIIFIFRGSDRRQKL
jgi:hypothetical protein